MSFNSHGKKNNNNRRGGGRNNQRRKQRGGKRGEESFSPQQIRQFQNKQDQHLKKAKDFLAAGERVEAENQFQHAEHYFRLAAIGNAALEKQRAERAEKEEKEQAEKAENAEAENAEAVDVEAPAEADKTKAEVDGNKSEEAAESTETSEGEGEIAELPFLQQTAGSA